MFHSAQISRHSQNGTLAPFPPVKVGWNPEMALQAPATRQTIPNVKNIRSRSKWKTSLNPPPQLQFLILDGWQYAALANWVKGVKLDISAADNRLTALVSRSLSVTSGIPGSGIASTEAKSSVAVSERMEVVEKKDGSILSGR